MRDEPQFTAGKRLQSASLDFVGPKKRSLFEQYQTKYIETARISAPKAQANPAYRVAIQQSAPVSVAPSSGQVSNQLIGHPHSLEHVQGAVEQTQSSMFQAQPLQGSFYQEQDSYAHVSELPDMPLPNNPDGYLSSDDPAMRGVKTSHIIHQEDIMNKRSKIRTGLHVFAASTAVAACFALLFISISYIRSQRAGIVPAAMRTAFDFPIYEVLNNTAFIVDRETVAKGANDSIVYVAEQSDTKAKFIVSQQAVPEILKADDQYQQFLTQADRYASFDSKIGKAYFTRPPSLGEDISVVVKTDSTLMFIRGNGATSEQTWSQLLSLLTATK